MIFDSHAHYDSEQFDIDRDELLGSVLLQKGVVAVINMAADYESLKKTVALCEKYDYIYGAVGIHPECANDLPDNWLSDVEALLSHPKIVAVGEIGLDYYWDDTYKAEQKELFRRQIELALELSKPIIVHDREAHGDSLELVSRYPELRGVFHCFSGSAEMAKELLRRGWYLGFDGPVTYKNARKALEVMELCPIDRLLLETDSPYLSPVPMRGKRNDSRNLKYIAEKIAEVKGCAAEDIACAAYENGRRLFEI